MGRVKVVDKGPRNIDLDILLYGTVKFQHKRLTVPHVGIAEREFVLRPLAQLIPGKPLDPHKPWRVTQEYLNALQTTSESRDVMSTMTPVGGGTAGQSIAPLLPTRRTLVMGILNVTPDSFSDGGTHSASRPDELRASVDAMLAAGADMIDVGGQSTRPGSQVVTPEDEIARVVPAIEIIRSLERGRKVPISIDTYYSRVAEAAVCAGADVINDISAGTLDPDMFATAARLHRTIILNHTRGSPQTMTRAENTTYASGVVAGVAEELLARVAAAEAAGVRRWRMVLDPGLGFAKTGRDNVELLGKLDVLRDWRGLSGLGWLVGPSRKKFVGRVVGSKGSADDDAGTAGAVAAAVAGGADIVRVHNVDGMVPVVRMADAVWRHRTAALE
jgi:2-amino-4-hydroxy-6-hydroxymethyldihydropteridine diphosphokinase/dihydropteroate synthase